MPEIDNLSIQISTNETRAIDGLEKLAKTLERLKNAVNGAAPTKAEANKLRDFGQALNALRGAENIRLSSTIATQIGRIGTAIGRITSSDIQRIQELGSALRGLNGAGNGANVDLRVAGNNGQHAAQVAGAGGSVAPIVAPIENMGGEIQPVVDDIADASTVTDELADNMENASQTADNTARNVRNVGVEMRSASRHGQGFLASIVRIAKYRLIRSALKDMVQGFKDLYGYSKANGLDFAKSMDTITTSTTYLRNSLAAMVAPLVNALAPAIDFVIDKFVGLINIVNQFLAALTGASTYTAAKKYEQTWEDTFGSTGSKAKKTADEIKRTILGFDEINKLQKDTDNSGGSGSGSSPYTEGYKEMFETRAIDNNIKNVAEKIRSIVGPVFDWVKDNFDTILPIAEAIGAAILLWKLSGSLIPNLTGLKTLLSKISSIVGGLATAIITVALTYTFANDYIQTGNIGSLIADGLTGILGSAITGLVVAKGFGAQAGIYAASATLELAAITNLAVSLNDIVNNGINGRNILVGVLGIVEGAAAGFLVTKSISGALMGASLALAVALGITAISVGKGEGFTLKFLGLTLASGLTAAVAGSMIAKTFFSGVITPVAGGLVLGGIVLSIVMAISAINIDSDGKHTIQFLGLAVGSALTAGVAGWQIAKTFFKNTIKSSINGGLILGGITLSALLLINSIQITKSEGKLTLRAFGQAVTSVGLAAFVGWKLAPLIGLSGPIGALILGGIALTIGFIAIAANLTKSKSFDWGDVTLTADEIKAEVQKRFSIDIEATINLVGTTIENQETVRAELDQKIALFGISLNKLRIGVGLDNSDGTISDMQTQLDEILTTFKETQGANKAVLDVAINLVPPTDDEGNLLSSADILKTFNSAQTQIGTAVTDLGNELSGLLAKGISDGLTEREAEMVADLSAWIMRITKAGDVGSAVGEFKGTMQMALLSDLDEGSFKALTDTYFEQSDKLRTSLLEVELQSYSTLQATRDQLALTIQAYEGMGRSVPQSMRDTLDDMDKQLSAWNPYESVEETMRREQEPFKQEVLSALIEVYGGAFDEVAKSLNRDGYLSNLVSNFRLGYTSFDDLTQQIGGMLDQALRNALGDDYTYVMDMADKLEMTGWDIIGQDAQVAFFNELSGKLGGTKAVQVLKQLGYDMTGVIANGTASGISEIKEAGNNIVLSFADGTKTTLSKQDPVIAKMFQDTGENAANATKAGLLSVPMPTLKTGVDAVAGEVMSVIDGRLQPIVEGTTNTTNVVSAVAGDGMSNGNYGLSPEVSDVNAIANIAAAPEWGWAWNLVGFLGLNNLDADIWFDAQTPWGYWHKSPLEWLGLTNLSTVVSVTAKVAGSVAGVIGKIFGKAAGGVFSGGRWSDIPQYAGGTTNAHGSLFMAGEAGPEIVGHVGGRTEVLNKSQLAAAMYQAVNSAMQGVTLDANFYGGNEGAEENYDAMYQAMYDAFSAVMAGSAERDREKVQLLRSINDKDFNVDVSTASINKAQSRMNRRAGVTIAPVGT